MPKMREQTNQIQNQKEIKMAEENFLLNEILERSEEIIDLLKKQIIIQDQLLKFWKQYGAEYEELMNTEPDVNTKPV